MKNTENDKKKFDERNLDNISQSNKNNKLPEPSQNQNRNLIQKEKKRDSISSNIQNTSLNISLNNENQNQNIQNQNQNIYLSNPQINFPSKEYFNFSFFKRQMSSRSSDIDYYQDNKEGINEFFNTKCKSIISKDSEKQNNSKKSSKLNSFELSSSNLGNKDENIILTRANSARTKNRRSNNYIPKTVFFQRNNSNNQSCFYKKHHMGKLNMKNNSDKNLVLQYYGNNNEINVNTFDRNFLEMVNDKDDEGEEEDEENSEEDNEEEEDDCILTKKDKENFSVNYLTGSGGINLPKSTFSLFHRGSNNNTKTEKEKEKERKKEENKDNINSEIKRDEENQKDINIIFGDLLKEEIKEDENKTDNNNKELNNDESKKVKTEKEDNKSKK